MGKKIFILLVSLIYLNGCAGIPIRTNQKFEAYFKKTDTTRAITLMPIDIKCSQISAGGVTEEIDEWERSTNDMFKKYIIEQLERLPHIKISILEEGSIDLQFKEFLDEQIGLYRAVAQSVIAHTYMPESIFQTKVKKFDYTLGPALSRASDFIATDTLLFVSGSKTYWSGGRVLLAGCGLLLGAVTGVIIMPGSVPEWVAVSLIDVKTGDVMWFRYIGPPYAEVGDLRGNKVLRETVEYLFKDFGK